MINNDELRLNDNAYMLIPRVRDFPKGIPMHPNEGKNPYIQTGGGSCWIYHAIDPNQRKVLIKEYRDQKFSLDKIMAQESHDIITAAIDAYTKGAGEYHPIDIQIVTDSDGIVYQLFRDINADILCSDASSNIDLLRLLESYVGFLKGLNCVHSNGIIHKDIKPESIVRIPGNPGEEFYQPIDFGDAVRITEQGSLNNTDSTGGWYSQEDIDILENLRRTNCSEYEKFVFSLDCTAAARVLFYMLTKKQVFPATKEQLAAVLEKSLNIKESQYGIYIALIEFFHKAFYKQDITKRFLSCTAMIGELQAILDVVNHNVSTQAAKNIYYIDQLHEIQKDSFAKTKIKTIARLYSIIEDRLGLENFEVEAFNERYSLEIEKNNEIALKKLTFSYLFFSLATIITGIFALAIGIIDSITRQIASFQGILKPQTCVTFISMSIILIIVSHFLIDFVQDHGRAPRFFYVLKFRKDFQSINKHIVCQGKPVKKVRLTTVMNVISMLSVLILTAFSIINRKIFVGEILADTPIRYLFIATLILSIIAHSCILWLWNKQHSEKHSIHSKMGEFANVGWILLIVIGFLVIGMLIYGTFWSDISSYNIINIITIFFIVISIWLTIGCIWDELIFARNISMALIIIFITTATLYGSALSMVGWNTKIVYSEGQHYLISNSSGENSIGLLNYDSEIIYFPHAIESHIITKTISVQMLIQTNTHSAVVESGIKTIGKSTFETCKNLTKITIPKTIRIVENSAFLNCNLLTSVFYEGTIEEWHQITTGIQNDPLHKATIYCSDGIITP